jgi:hypothetical protein
VAEQERSLKPDAPSLVAPILGGKAWMAKVWMPR